MSWDYALFECFCELHWPKKHREDVKITKCPLKKHKRMPRGECFYIDEHKGLCPALGFANATKDFHASGAQRVVDHYLDKQQKDCERCQRAFERYLKKKLKGKIKMGGG